MKTKEQLTKEFNKVQKEYIEAVRLNNQKRIAQLSTDRMEILRQLRRLDGKNDTRA